MKKPISILLGSLFLLTAGFSESGPTLTFDGVNGYPSTGDSTYRIEIFVAPNGLISEIKAYAEDRNDTTESTKIRSDKDRIIGVCESMESRTTFDFAIGNNKIFRHIVVTNKVKNKVFSDSSSTVVITPRAGILFETDGRRYTQRWPGDLQVFDKKSNEHLYTFLKNTAVNEGWYRSDWKTKGKVTTVHEYQTMEKGAEWIDAGHGVFVGDTLAMKDLLSNVINFCILDVVYTNNPIFIPFIFGLKTGSY